MEAFPPDCHPLTDFLKYSIDWISVTNDKICYDEMLILLDRNEIKFDERYFMNNKYVVIQKDCYERLLMLLTTTDNIRITRIDIKIDFCNKFEDVVINSIAVIEPYSSISKGGKLQTLYFNSRQSDMFCRLYDKQAESCLDFPLTRLEFEVKGDLAYEFSKRVSYVGLEDATNFIYDKINDFCKRKHLDHIFYVTTRSYLSFEVIEEQTIKEKFRRFVRHNRNSYENYMVHFDLTPNEFDDIMCGAIDLEKFLNKR